MNPAMWLVGGLGLPWPLQSAPTAQRAHVHAVMVKQPVASGVCKLVQLHVTALQERAGRWSLLTHAHQARLQQQGLGSGAGGTVSKPECAEEQDRHVLFKQA